MIVCSPSRPPRPTRRSQAGVIELAAVIVDGDPEVCGDIESVIAADEFGDADSICDEGDDAPVLHADSSTPAATVVKISRAFT
jgi:hypothetical protein